MLSFITVALVLTPTTCLQDLIDGAVKTLLELKAKFKSATGKDWKPGVEVPAETKPVALQSAPQGSSVENILVSIAQQGDRVRDLKSAKADKNTLDTEVKALLALKAKYKEVSGQDWKPPAQQPSAKPAKETKMSVQAVTNTAAEPNKEAAELQDKITKQGEKVRELKSKSAPKVI